MSNTGKYRQELMRLADEIERMRLLIFTSTDKDDEFRQPIDDELFALQSKLRYDIAGLVYPFDDNPPAYIPKTFIVYREDGDVFVSIYRNKEDNTYSFVNHSKGHVCTCKFDSVELAMADLEKEKQEGRIIDYKEI